MNPPYRRMALGVILGIGMLGAIPGVAFAAAPACGDTLMANTTLHANLDCSLYVGTDPGLTLGKNGITLDLNGYTVTGPTGDDNLYGLYSEYNNVTITDGTVWGFNINVFLEYSTGALVTWLTVNDEAVDTNETGIEIDYGVGNKVRHNTVTMDFDDDTGIYMYEGASNVLKWNESTGYYGFEFYYETKDLIAHNIGHSDSYGFYDDSSGGQQYLNNRANGTGGTGFYLNCAEYGPITVIGNTANNNGSDGFYTDDCYVYPPGAPRLSLISGNTANDNGDDGFDDYYSIGATFSGNTANRNGDDGIYLDYPGDIRIINNTLRANTDSGLEMEDAWGVGYGSPKRISGNYIRGNEYGIYSDYGVPNGVCFGNTLINNTYPLTSIICN